MPDTRASSAGLLATFYAIRHDLGLYHCAAVAGSYRFTSIGGTTLQAVDELKSCIVSALSETINQHPQLQTSILYDPRYSGEARFIQHAVIAIDDVLTFRYIPSGVNSASSATLKGNQNASSLAGELQRLHSEPFSKPESTPSWRVVALRYDDPWTKPLPSHAHIDTIFAFHHAIADGVSGLSFHRSFNQNLPAQRSVQPAESWVSFKPAQTDIPPQMEQVVGFPTKSHLDHSPVPLPTKPSETLNKPPVHVDGVTLNNPDASSNLRILEVPNIQLKQLLSFCKTQHITLTGLLHGMIVSFLSRLEVNNNTQTTAIKAFTPFSMRRQTQISNDEIINCISYVANTFPSSLLQRFQTCKIDSPGHLDLLKDVANTFAGEMKKEQEQEPQNQSMPRLLLDAARLVPILATTPEVYLQQNWNAEDKNITYELSNLGMESVADLSSDGDVSSASGLHLKKLVFSQCYQGGSGPDLCVNCVSVKGGPLVITVTRREGWRDGSVLDGLLGELVGICERLSGLVGVGG